MRILSFDTSANELHVSLLEDREVAYERLTTPSSSERQEVAQILMPEIDRAFKEANWKKNSLDCVVVGSGPGSFTGIRVAIITGRTIAQIFKLPLIPVCLLDTYYASTGDSETAAVVLGSTPPQCFFGGYHATSTDPSHAQLPPSVAAAPAVTEALELFSRRYFDEKAASTLKLDHYIPLPKLKNVGTIQAQLAWDRLSLNGFATDVYDWQKALPLYLRSPSVTIKKNYAPANSPNDSR